MLYLQSRLSDNAAMNAPFRARAASDKGLFPFLALLGIALGAIANPGLVDQGQRAFQNGAFGQAANHWEKAVDSFRKEGNTNAEIQTSLSLNHTNCL